MAKYTPKSKVNILQTTGTEFVIASTKQPYKGSYMEFSDGSLFAGNNPSNPKERLVRNLPLSSRFQSGINNLQYKDLKTSIHEELSKIVTIPPSKPVPTIDDYKRGYFTRYFCKRVNEKINYFEIDKETFNLLSEQDPKYDYKLHIIGEIKWTLIESNPDSVEQINKNIINLKSIEFPLIEILFKSLLEYSPPYTKGNEYVIKKGKQEINYVGYYHFHPESGFLMEGAFHVPTKHKRLFVKTEKVSGRPITRDDSSNTTNNLTSRMTRTPRTPTTTPPRVSQPTTTPNLTSYGGGGGY
tara:strand:+ start:5581 stop:6474 length:894 start_codon:yes stop_codon:yes gene_type:complete